jgi:hypothetical protein
MVYNLRLVEIHFKTFRISVGTPFVYRWSLDGASTPFSAGQTFQRLVICIRAIYYPTGLLFTANYLCYERKFISLSSEHGLVQLLGIREAGTPVVRKSDAGLQIRGLLHQAAIHHLPSRVRE